jgi:hypothetical protein
LNNSQSRLVSVQVSSSRSSLPSFVNPVEIFGNLYFAVQNGFPYHIKIQNLSNSKLLIVGSVDGRSIFSDKDAELSDSGYVISPSDEIVIKGFRFDDDEVGEFLANENLMQTIASLSGGNTSKIGCVALAIFREKSYEPVFKTLGGGNSRSWGEEKSIGTSVGQSLSDKVSRVNFERNNSQPDQIIELNYRPLSMLTQVSNQFPDNLNNKPFSKPKTGIQNYQVTK